MSIGILLLWVDGTMRSRTMIMTWESPKTATQSVILPRLSGKVRKGLVAAMLSPVSRSMSHADMILPATSLDNTLRMLRDQTEFYNS